MNRSQLEHIIRAAGSIADDNELIVLGSASVFAQFPDLPDHFLLSIEADVFPKNKPHMTDIIDGSIGELSPFHEAFGYYAHGVTKDTAGNLPLGWEKRLIPIRTDNTGGITGWCLDIHDLIAGKYAAAREKDFEFIQSAVKQGLVKEPLLHERIEMLPIDASLRSGILNRLKRDLALSPNKKA
ncbi:MAG: hypothetical protein HGA74_03940 [Deltaproteobacteria bacterium]|jgi:hypothetical protein|nr:hypothetical protein [Deltaproteobacteria bacterium]